MKRQTFLTLLCAVVLANYIAQVPYGWHLYGWSSALRHSAPLAITLVWFLAGVIFVARRKVGGYWLLLGFVAVEFLFYLYNTVGEVVHGYGLFFHIWNPDHLLAVVFAIGYFNFLADAYFLFYLVANKRKLREPVTVAA